MRSRHTTYWVCQTLGWGVYAAVNFAAFAGSAPGPWRALLVTLAYSGSGLGLTHLLRLRFGAAWSRLRLSALAPRAVAASLVLSLVLNGAFFAVDRASGVNVPGPLAFILYFNGAVLFLGWQLIYFGVHLLQRTRQAELTALRLEAAAKSAQLRQLQSQLNPHFLFNCLNALRGLIAVDPARAMTAVTELANLLRYALADEAKTVPLSRELEIVRDYLALESLRLEERLRVTLDIAPDCLSLPVPPMLLQTLVENAIKHGIARLPCGGELTVRARQEQGQLALDVLNPRAPSEGSDTRIGLSNARNRLALLFGAAASLELDLTQTERAVARVRIPCR